jgi:hypothetical protein
MVNRVPWQGAQARDRGHPAHEREPARHHDARGRQRSLDLVLSAVRVDPIEHEFPAAVVPYDKAGFDAMRDRVDVFVYRRKREPLERQVLAIPLLGGPLPGLPVCEQLEAKRNLVVLSRLLERRLPDLVPKLGLQRVRFGLERIRRSEDLCDEILKRAKLTRPAILDAVRIHHRTRLHVRQEFLPGYGPLIALTIEFQHAYELEGTAADLIARGANLKDLGLFGIGEHQGFLGYVASVRNGVVQVVNEQGETTVDPHRCRVESSKATFGALLDQAFDGRMMDRYDAAEWSVQAEAVSGDGYLTRLREVAEYFHSLPPLAVAEGLTMCFGELLRPRSTGREPSAIQLPAIDYCFSSDRTAIDTIPFHGLDQHGPFDARRFDKKEPRIAFVFPRESREEIDRFARRFLEGMAIDEKKRFARGFAATYRLHKVITQFVDIDLSRSNGAIGQCYVDALANMFDPARKPDIVFVVVRDEDAFIDRGNPYLASKAYLLAQGLPSQEVRVSKLRSSSGNLQYIIEDIAVAAYAKMGGCPWTLASSMPLTKELVIGLAYAEFGGRFQSRTRYMGIATVFTSDGTYLLAAQSPRCKYEDYPEALANTVKTTLARLVEQYAWDTSEVVRLVFHTSKPLTKRDIETVSRVAVKELGRGVQFEAAFVTIRRDHPFKVVDPAEDGRDAFVELVSGGQGRARIARRVPSRGIVVDLGRSKRLVCVHGTTLAIREGEGIPQPLMVELHSNSTYTNISALARQVYQFTGLSWGSMKPVSEPVTIHYARLIAKMLGRLDGHPNWNDGLLDTHLRTSRWFL